MAYCELISYRFAVRVDYEAVQDVKNNQTVIQVTSVSVKSFWGDVGNCWMMGTVKVNGTTAVDMILGSVYSCAFLLSSEYDGCGPGSSGFTVTNVAVPHNADGTAADITFAINMMIQVTGGPILEPSVSGTVKAALGRIPRVSTISADGVELGNTMTIRLNRASTDFRERLEWQCGSQSGLIAEYSADTAFSFTPALALASQQPNSVNVPVTLKVTTYTDGTAIGSGELAVTCRVPESVVPTVSASVTDPMGYASDHGGYIQGRSQARVVTQAEGAYGSSIRDIAVTCGSSGGSGADVTFALNAPGYVGVSVTVTDSRGRKAVQQLSIPVLAYSAPYSVIRRVFRCDESGNEQADGAWAAVVFDAQVTQVLGNTARYQLVRQVRGGEMLPDTPMSEYQDWLQVSSGSIIVPAGIDSSYDCRIRVTDSFGAAESRSVTIFAAFVLLDLYRNARAVGIGMRAKNETSLSIGLDTDMDGHRLTDLPDPTDSTDAATMGYVDRRLRELANLLGVEW